jgi:hypothetical protein
MKFGLRRLSRAPAALAILGGLAASIFGITPSLAVPTAHSQRDRYEWALWARLERSTAVDHWMDSARSHIPDRGQIIPTVLDVMRGIVGAFGDLDIRFRGGPMERYGQDPQGSDHVQPPEMLLASRRGKCTDTALLVAGTLLEMKQEAVLVLTSRHVIAAAVSELPLIDGVHGVPLPVAYPGISGSGYIYALDATFFGGDFQLATAMEEGQSFAYRALEKIDARIIRPSTGEVIWDGRKASAIRFGAPLPRPSKL